MMDFKTNRAAIYLKNGIMICVGHLPGRKRLALYTQDGVYADPLAYFLTEDDAQKFVELMEQK